LRSLNEHASKRPLPTFFLCFLVPFLFLVMQSSGRRGAGGQKSPFPTGGLPLSVLRQKENGGEKKHWGMCLLRSMLCSVSMKTELDFRSSGLAGLRPALAWLASAWTDKRSRLGQPSCTVPVLEPYKATVHLVGGGAVVSQRTRTAESFTPRGDPQTKM